MLLISTIAAAAASSVYPDELAADVGVSCDPVPCTLCHSTAFGGGGTVTQPFGQAMMTAGLRGGEDVDGLLAALDRVEADGVDSDDDGVPDLEALAANLDPNTGEGLCGELTPVYGCLSHTSSAPLGWLAMLPLVLLVRRRAR